MRAEVAREIGRPNRFVVLEVWKDQAAFEAHGKAATTTALPRQAEDHSRRPL